MEYKVINGHSRQELEEHVNSALKEGWEPLGGLVVDEANTQTRLFYQAVVKE